MSAGALDPSVKCNHGAAVDTAMKRRFWISILVQLALMILLVLGLAKTTIAGRYLLVLTALWFAAVLLWTMLGPSSFFLGLGKRNWMKSALVFAFGCLWQILVFGWLAPLAVGIYRIAER